MVINLKKEKKRNKKFPQILEAMNSFDLSTKSKQSTRPIRTKRSIKRSPVLSTILITWQRVVLHGQLPSKKKKKKIKNVRLSVPIIAHERFFEREKWQQRQKMDVHRWTKMASLNSSSEASREFAFQRSLSTANAVSGCCVNEIIFRARCTSSCYPKHFIRINECECGNARSEIFDHFFPLLFLFFFFCNGGFFTMRSCIWWQYVVEVIISLVWCLIINLKKKLVYRRLVIF